MAWLRRSRVPREFAGLLGPDEAVLAATAVTGGGLLVGTRRGVWQISAGNETPQLYGWQTISKARWQPPVLELTVSVTVGSLGEAELIEDQPPLRFEVGERSKLTDLVHSRVRGGIVSSEHHLVPGGGAWVVVRRVPGRDGVVVNVRLDPGTSLDAAGAVLEPLVAEVISEAR